MQDSIIDVGSMIKSKNLNESVWQTRKTRQQSEKEIELLLNRLQLLKKEETLTGKKIQDTRKRTQEVINLKQHHSQVEENKKNSQRDDDEKIKSQKQRNIQLKKEQQEQLKMIKEASRQIKKEEHDEVKQFQIDKLLNRKISIKNKEVIEQLRKGTIEQNINRNKRIHEVMRQSKSNINLFWQDKIGRIQRENDKYNIYYIETNFSMKTEHIIAQSKNEIVLSKLEEEELSLINKLQKSQEIQEQLSLRLERAMNLPHDDFKQLYHDDNDIVIDSSISKIKNSTVRKDRQIGSSLQLKSNITTIDEYEAYEKAPKTWLPHPEYEEDNEKIISEQDPDVSSPKNLGQKKKTKKLEQKIEHTPSQKSQQNHMETQTQGEQPQQDQEGNGEEITKINENKTETEVNKEQPQSNEQGQQNSQEENKGNEEGQQTE